MKKLRIVSFNFQNDNRFDNNKIDKLVDMVVDNNVDILCIQELTYKYKNEIIKRLSNYNFAGKYRFGNSLKMVKYNENNNIITKEKILFHKTIRLPWLIMKIKDFIYGTRNRLIIPRIATIALLENDICIINTHLSSSKIPSIQYRQLKKLEKIMNKYIDYNIILTGDFNMVASSFNFQNRFFELNHVDISENTWRNYTIDHLFLANNFKVLKKGIIDMQDISDHNAIYVDVKL